MSGIIGGFATAVLVKGQASGTWWNNLLTLTGATDILGGLLKATVFGAIIGLVACYKGYNATGGAAGVGRAVNDTVVVSITSFIVVNYFLTSALFGAVGF